MRYEHIELDISTAACDVLLQATCAALGSNDTTWPVKDELVNLMNELRARLQRRDADPHCPKNVPTEDWLDA